MFSSPSKGKDQKQKNKSPIILLRHELAGKLLGM